MGNQNVQNQWSADLNESAFTARNIYMHYSMDLSQEEKAVSSEKLFYQVTHGKFPICLRVWPIPISQPFPSEGEGQAVYQEKGMDTIRIPQGVQLTQNQQNYVVDVLMTWIEKENTGK